ncbi:MAG: YfhO family protein [Bacteroidia bacterium]
MNIKKFIPHLVAIGAFLAVSLFYFSPLIDGKKQIQQSDITHYKGTAQEITEFRKEHKGEEPLWTNSMFGGMPAYQISVVYHANLMKYIDNALQLWLPHPIGMVFLYFFGFYILLLCLRINPWIAAVGAFAYGFSSFFFIILEVGHNTQAHAIAYMAPLLGGIILTLRKNYIVGGALTTLFASLEMYSNHVQITYYFFMIVAAIMVVEFYSAIKEKRIPDFIKRGAIIVAAVMIAVLPNVSNLWATYEYGKYTTRGTSDLTINEQGKSNEGNKTSGLDKDYATQWSYGISETFNLMIPNFKGGVSEPISSHNKNALDAIPDPQMKQYAGSMSSYFGDQYFTLGPVYIGAIMVFLAVLGLFLIKDRIKWALLAITIISIMLAWGKNLMWFTDIFFNYMPGYNKFRAVSMILVIAELTIPLLAVLALQKIYESNATTTVNIGKKTMATSRVLIIAAAITGGFALLCYLAPDMFNKFQADNELRQLVAQAKQQDPNAQVAQIESAYTPVLEQAEIARKAIFKSDAIRSFIFILLVFGALWFYLSKKLNEQLLFAALGVFVLADMWPVAARYLNSNNYVPKAQMQSPFTKSKADEFILEDKSLDYRVLKLGNPFNDASTSYWHKSIGGYHGAKLKRYHELMSFQLDQNMAALMQTLRSAGGISDSVIKAAFTRTQVLNMLNTKYVIINDDAAPLVNPLANGNAWFVKNILPVNSANDEILKLSVINTKETAIINEKYNDVLNGFKPQFDADASIKLNSYQPNKLVYETNAKTSQLAVFSEIYYPKGWIATIDGKESPYVNADYVLRAMVIPEGKHTVEFNFKPAVYVVGEKISMAGSILVILISFGGLFYGYRKEQAA